VALWQTPWVWSPAAAHGEYVPSLWVQMMAKGRNSNTRAKHYLPTSSADDCAYMTWNLCVVVILLFLWQIIAQLIAVFVWNDGRCGTSARYTWSWIFDSTTADLPQLWPLDVVRLSHAEFYLASAPKTSVVFVTPVSSFGYFLLMLMLLHIQPPVKIN